MKIMKIEENNGRKKLSDNEASVMTRGGWQ
jgi:hypothetical protein